jgi:biotin-(acetyl-CoA carboxylase) ligase
MPLLAEQTHKSRIHLQEVDSTQFFAKEHLEELNLNEVGKWALITANRQNNPAPSHERKLEPMGDGHLYATFMTLFPAEKLHDMAYALQLSTFAIAEALEEYGIDARITPVNDVIVGNKKISDCFCDIMPSSSRDFHYLSVDVNLNVNTDVEQTTRIPTSTSMFAETGKKFNKEQVLATVSSHLKNAINQFLERGVNVMLVGEVNDHLAFKGEMVEIELEPNSTVTGKFLGLDDAGDFLLEVQPEEVWKINGGRIVRAISDKAVVETPEVPAVEQPQIHEPENQVQADATDCVREASL